MTQKTKTIKSGPLFRAATFTRENIDKEARTVDLAFSSEEPVDRWFGQEILDHSMGAVRLGRLRNHGPVLVDHDRRDHVGVVESVTIDSDRKGRATVRFGNSARADEIFKDMTDGIRSKVSVGYRIHEMVLEKESDAGNTYRVTDWEPFEISIVSVPADDGVGVGRAESSEENDINIQYEERAMSDKDNKDQQRAGEPAPATPAAPAAASPVVDVRAEREQGAQVERERVSGILKLGRENGQEQLADRFIEQGRHLDDFRAVVETIKEQAPAVRTDEPVTKLGFSDKDTKRYSLLNAIRASMSGNWDKEAGFERECSQAIEDDLGKEARGFFVPYEVQQRVMNVTTGTDLIATDHLAGSFIDSLRARAVLGEAGATFLPGLQGNIDIPKKVGSASFQWLADDADVSDSDLSLGSVAMTPHTVAGSVPMSRRLLKQSAPSIEALVMSDLAVGAALAIDIAGLEGTGLADQPTGIVNQVGVNTQAVATAGQPTWAEIVGFESALDADEALMGALSYITTASVRGHCKTAVKDAGSGRFIYEDGQVNDYRMLKSGQLAVNRIIFGNFSDVLIGMWGVLDVMPDVAAKAASGGLVLRVFQDVDVAVRHAESFCINA